MLTQWSIDEIVRARSAVGALLEAAGLDAYLFQVEPAGDDRWEVKLEWAADQAWTTSTLSAGRHELLRSLDDPSVRDHLLEHWRRTLGSSISPPAVRPRRSERSR